MGGGDAYVGDNVSVLHREKRTRTPYCKYCKVETRATALDRIVAAVDSTVMLKFDEHDAFLHCGRLAVKDKPTSTLLRVRSKRP